MIKKPKHYEIKPRTKVIRKYGYEYFLVEVERPKDMNTEQPCFMGFPGMALQGFKKIIKTK
jgi:hypothetical protein